MVSTGGVGVDVCECGYLNDANIHVPIGAANGLGVCRILPAQVHRFGKGPATLVEDFGGTVPHGGNHAQARSAKGLHLWEASCVGCDGPLSLGSCCRGCRCCSGGLRGANPCTREP